MSKKPAKSSEPRYETLIDELEGIVRSIESGETGLEGSITAYEHGVGLIKQARAILDQAEQRITELDPSGDENDGESSGSAR
ncbi:MAG: exodeoxyribonuclease VII small subunit [Phycisphaerales bacterium]|nr:exodeoxyribonuclease VII small subunit [Phycisphaerales bacterium]